MAPIDDVIEFPESASTSILECLQRLGLGHEERRKLIIEAEALPFDVEQATALLPLLRRFIEEFRGSNVPAGLVAVGSAIRNYVAVAPTDEALEGAASLLRVDGRHALPIELEVETTKMVVRKLTANLPAQRERYCELAIRLEELIDDYTRPRFLARAQHGAVALNAVLGLVLARRGRDSVVIDKMRTLGVSWFQQLVGRRAALLRAELFALEADPKFADIDRALEELNGLDFPNPAS